MAGRPIISDEQHEGGLLGIFLFIVAGLMLGGLAYLYSRRTEDEMSRGVGVTRLGVVPPSSGAEASPPEHNFRAVAVHPGQGACRAVRDIADRRFLSNKAPPLPVPGCDAKRCECRYDRYPDRRDDDDRRFPYRRLGGFVGDGSGTERRVLKDRRRD